MKARFASVLALLLCSAAGPAGAQAQIDWVLVGNYRIARTETTIGQFRRFVDATGVVTLAERRGGGEVYEAGWVQKQGWTWSAPFGPGYRPQDDEPAVHLAYDEAQAFCRWAGGRLPTDEEWLGAAYVERRKTPPAPFVSGRRYAFPQGDTPSGAQCLGDCGPQDRTRAVPHGVALARGYGHSRVGSTPPGVNGLYDMGGNAWEWVDEPRTAVGVAEKRTRGGSWWYGARQMQADYLQSKPKDTAVVYIGFRCARDP
jgi:formylglycine-generating enzyme required for sulfatase activity